MLCLAAVGRAEQPAAPTHAAPTQPHVSAAPAVEAGTTDAASEDFVSQVPRDQFADLWFSNRLIITFRAKIVPRDPEARAEGAERALSRLADSGVTGPVASRALRSATVVTVAGRDVFGIVAEDVEAARDDDLGRLTARTIARVQLALTEAAEARAPRRLAWGGAKAVAATVLLALALVAIVRLYRLMVRRMLAAAETRIARLRVGGDATLVRATRVMELTRGIAMLGAGVAGATVVYTWLTFVLQQFPLTRPWGEALGGFLVGTFSTLGWGMLSALPGLFTAVVIFVLTRFAVRLSGLLFQAVEEGRLELAGLSGPKAVATRRLVNTALWLFAIVVAYPYLPGSSTEAFKGISVFVGLVVSLGSSGIVNQLMSGFMLTYSGALAPGDYVRIGEVEGKVTALSVLSTKVRTRRNEDVTIPNAVVVSGTTVNYSQLRR